MVTTKLMTAEELERFAPGDDYRYELIRGVLKRMSPVGLIHGKYVRRITIPLSDYVDEHQFGEVFVGDTGFVLARDPDIVLGPDIAFVRADRLPPEVEADRYGRMAPDLVIEVVSPSDRPSEIAEKVAIYREAGVPLMWFFDPKRRQVRVHPAGQPPVDLGADDVLDGGDVLPGFRLPLVDVFRQVCLAGPPPSAERTVAVHGAGRSVRLLEVNDVLAGGDFLPGFRLNVAAIFEQDHQRERPRFGES